MPTNREVLQRDYKAFTENFGSDSELTKEAKKAFSDFVDGVSDQAELFDKCQDYCRDPDNQLLGTTQCRGNDHQLGHAVTSERLKNRLTDLLGMRQGKEAYRLFIELKTCKPKDRDSLTELLNRKRLDANVYTNDRIRQVLGKSRVPAKKDYQLREAKVKPYICWSFEMDSKGYSTFEREIVNLPCRLGLYDWRSEHQLLHFSLGRAVILHKPTSLDAGINNEYFQTGGRTKPHDDCKHSQGLEEWVHSSPLFRDIDHKR